MDVWSVHYFLMYDNVVVCVHGRLLGEICYYGDPHVRLRRFGGVGEGLADMEKQGIGHSLKRARTLHYLALGLCWRRPGSRPRPGPASATPDEESRDAWPYTCAA